jgi:lipopolysaccharide transport system ATP-binding protein
VAALLELGAGFNPEFTGRENVYINGEIMGLSRGEIDRAIGSIENFAEIGEFFDHPVKLYSSGMYVRLAFSTAIHVEPDILVVDEALAVGDAVFSSRCVRKFEELQRGGMTILFVSHDLGLVKQICHRAIFLHHGRIVEEGEPSHVINRYVGTVLERQKAALPPAGNGPDTAPMQFSHRHGDRLAEVSTVEIFSSSGQPTRAANGGEHLRISFTARFHQDQAEPMAGILIRTRTGLDVFGTNTKAEGMEIGPVAAGESVQVEFEFDCWLTAQEYTLTVAVQHPDGHSHDWLDDVIVFRVIEARRLAGVANLHPTVGVRKIKAE